MAFGGAGPVHANRLAAENEIPLTVIPMSPGITCAMGLVVTDLKHDYSVTLIRRVDLVDPAEVENAYLQMQAQGQETLAREGIPPEEMTFLRQVDMRYVGQSYELTVLLPVRATGRSPLLTSTTIARVLDQFHQEHDRAYGYAAPSEPVEFVNLRLTAIGKIAKPRLREVEQVNADAALAQKATRRVYFAEADGYVDCPIYDRYRMGAGCVIEGPAVVEEIDSTTVIHPGYQAQVDTFGNLILTST